MGINRFPDIAKGYPFPELEMEVLAEWREKNIFELSLKKTENGAPFVFFEGPPTANNRPHIGHVVTRVIKDLFPRFQTMRGRHVVRKAGWDTHGLPVEIEVEKQLGFSGKQDIEAYGIEKFNQACLESVHTYQRQWREMTERIGFWLDFDSAYYTYLNTYIESIWWALKRLWEQELLLEDYKIQPYCARCGTTLSSHEVAQNYKDTDDPSIWVLFAVRPGQTLRTLDGTEWPTPDGLKLVAWTTTPWTLLGHSGIAVSPDLVYKVVEHPKRPTEHLLFAEGLETQVPLAIEGDGERERLDLRDLPAEVRFRGGELEGLRYDRPFKTDPADQSPKTKVFDPPPSDADGWCVFPADYVTASEGTGLVHTAPAFGEDDYQSGLAFGLPVFLTVDAEGRIVERQGIEAYAGAPVKDSDKRIIQDLKVRGQLLHSDRYHHNYPFCWRCDQPLIYYASKSWFIKTTARKDDLAALNQQIEWHPEHVRDGRFGKWLENVVDWALSRKRYWGTPLPVWRCSRCGAIEVIGSFIELFDRAGKQAPSDLYDREQFDPHRPFIDEYQWDCSQCGHGTEGRQGTMERVDDVIDAWFDSGAMFFAQYHYPFENSELIDEGKQFPADFIAEAVDQTRGWFYTLHVLSTLLFDSVSYKTCIVLGHINDELGRKMSKRLGNVVDPMEVIPQTGADALRWYFCVNNPEVNSRFSTRLVREAAQNFLLPLWNALSFFTIYANLDGWEPGGDPIPFDDRSALDQWIIGRLDNVTTECTHLLEGYRVAETARVLETFIDDLTNWYIRRSRDRFWAPAGDASQDKDSAYQTLYTVLTTTARLLAPLTPFVADVLHRQLVRSQIADAAPSVHLEDWPVPSGEEADEQLSSGMAAIQRIVRLGHAARNAHGLKTRQPLLSVTIVTTDRSLKGLVAPRIELLRDELNVKEILWADERSAFVKHKVLPVFSRLGPRIGSRMPSLKRALEAADGEALVSALEESGTIQIQLDGQALDLSGEDVEIRLVEREGTATQGDRELMIALDTRLDDNLIAEGWAREVIHRLQTARKEADLDYADRIKVRYRAHDKLEDAIEIHRQWIAGETLAVELAPVANGGTELETRPVEGMEFEYSIERI